MLYTEYEKVCRSKISFLHLQTFKSERIIENYFINISVFIMHINPIAMRETFNIPESIEPVALLVMGYPADDSQPIDMHYKYRNIDEVVFYDSF